MQLFYNPEILETTKEIMFDKVESAHIVRVLRKKESDILHITNGKGFLFDAKLSLQTIKNVWQASSKPNKNQNLGTTICILPLHLPKITTELNGF